MVNATGLKRVKGIIDTFDLGVDTNRLEISELGGGASNENFLVRHEESAWVFRLAAPTVLSDRFALDRWSGFAAHKHAEALGITPRLHAIALPAGHTLVELIDGVTLDAETIFEGQNLEDAALALRTVHCGGSWACGRFNGLVEIERFLKISSDESLALPHDISQLVELARKTEQMFTRVGVPEVLCHNDVQIQNLIRDRQQRLWVIDWEYGGIGNPYFDLAMLVNNAGLDRAHTARVLSAYFGSDTETDYARVELARFQSALREAMWSVVAEPVLQTGWDYQEWAARFFDSARVIKGRIEDRDLLREAGPVDDDDVRFAQMRREK